MSFADATIERLPGPLRPFAERHHELIKFAIVGATPFVIDMAVSACVTSGLGSPPTYGDAFRLLGRHGVVETGLADRLARAAAFRNLLVHAYGELDLRRVHTIASQGPADLLAFLAALRDA